MYEIKENIPRLLSISEFAVLFIKAKSILNGKVMRCAIYVKYLSIDYYTLSNTVMITQPIHKVSYINLLIFHF